MTTIRHIVFDIGRVLIHYDPAIPLSRIIPDEQRRQWFFNHVCSSDWNLEQDRGRSWAEAEREAIAAYPEWEAEIRAFRANWHEMVSHAYDDTVAIMERLIADGHDVTMLTNFAADTFAEACQRFAFLSAPRGVTVSGLIGHIKPDAEIYHHHVRTYSLEPKATLFIDDSQKNVDGAIAAGWRAIRYDGAEQLKADLRHLGIPV